MEVVLTIGPPWRTSTVFRATLYEFDFPGGSEDKVSVYNVGDLGSIPGSGRSPGGGNGNPLQYSGLENLMDRERSLAGCSHMELDMTEVT